MNNTAFKSNNKIMKNKITTVFFGLDGVIVDTETYNKKFWDQIAASNGLKIENFSNVVEGMTLNSIIELYFPLSSLEERQSIRKASADLEQSIDYKSILVPGILEFIQYLKEEDYNIGLVTSSSLNKVNIVLDQLDIKNAFDTIITAESIKKGKPDPMGYVLAKTNLIAESSECIVFEDSFTGIKAATYAFMRVIGIETSLSEDSFKDYTYASIPDFSDLERVKKLLD